MYLSLIFLIVLRSMNRCWLLLTQCMIWFTHMIHRSEITTKRFYSMPLRIEPQDAIIKITTTTDNKSAITVYDNSISKSKHEDNAHILFYNSIWVSEILFGDSNADAYDLVLKPSSFFVLMQTERRVIISWLYHIDALLLLIDCMRI